MTSIFSRIVSGEIPCHKIREDERYLAFLDIRPIARGHTLVIPKLEVDYLFDLDESLLAGMLPFARPIAHAIQRVVACKRVGIAVVGLEVPHAHMHLVPLREVGDLRFGGPVLALSQDELAGIAENIRSEITG